MSDHLAELARHRRRLQHQAAWQRRQLAEDVHEIESGVGGPRGLFSARSLLQKPVLLAGGAALLYFMGPGRAIRLAGRAVFWFSTAKRVVGLVSKVRAAGALFRNKPI